MGAILMIIVYVIAGVIFGLIAQHIAESKGYATGFAWGFWLGALGLIIVALKPDVRQPAGEYRPMYPDAVPSEKPQWTCSCGAKNSAALSYCTACRRTKDEATAVKKVICPHCGASNNENNKVCFACNRNISEEAAVQTTPLAAADTELATNAVSSDETDPYKTLEKLYSLYERGILTDEEYTQKKVKILETM